MSGSYLYLLGVLIWLSSWRTMLDILQMAARQSGKGPLQDFTNAGHLAPGFPCKTALLLLHVRQVMGCLDLILW